MTEKITSLRLTESRPIGPLQLSHHVTYFHKMMVNNLTNVRNGKNMTKRSKWPSLRAPIVKEWDFMTVWIFKRMWRFVWKKLLESKTLLSCNVFHRNALNFPKIQTVIYINLLFNSRGVKLGHFDIFDALFPLTAHNKNKFQEKFGHVPQRKGPIYR